MQIATSGLAFVPGHAPHRSSKRLVVLRNEVLNVEHLRSRAPKYHLSERNEVELCLVHFYNAGNAEHRGRFEKITGRKLERYLPWNTFLMPMTRQDIRHVETSLNDVVMWVGPYESKHKFSRQGLEESIKSCGDTCVFHAIVLTENGGELKLSLERDLRSKNIEAQVNAVNSKKISIKFFNSKSQNILDLAESVSTRHDILWIEAKPQISLRNKYAAITVQVRVSLSLSSWRN